MAETLFADRIVQNLLDTDFYKLTMMQAVLHNYPNTEVEWEFRCRTDENLAQYVDEIRAEIHNLAKLEISPGQLDFMRAIRFIKPDFIRFLGLFRFNPDYVQVAVEKE